MRAPKPTLEELRERIPEGQRPLYEHLRRGAAALPGVREGVMFDSVLREWVPGWSTARGQLFHIHLEDHLSATLPLREEDCPAVLASPAVPESLKGRLRRAARFGESRWVHLALADTRSVEELLALAARKNELRRGERGPGGGVRGEGGG